jgi:hypothetical protein
MDKAFYGALYSPTQFDLIEVRSWEMEFKIEKDEPSLFEPRLNLAE